MKRRTLFTTTAALAAVGAAPRTAAADFRGRGGRVAENLSMPSAVLGTDVLYSLYLPPGFTGDEHRDDGRTLPVLYLHHGSGDDNTAWLRKGDAQAVLDRAVARREIPPTVVVMPDARRDTTRPAGGQYLTYHMNDADGSHRYADMFVEEFVPFVERRHRVGGTSGRRCVGGLSMGGFGALSYALRHPGMFAAAFSLSTGFRTDEQIVALDMDAYNHRYGRAWGEDLEGEARLNDLYRHWNLLNAIDRTPADVLSRTAWFLDCGAYDGLFEGNADLHLALTRKGVPHRFMSREGGHDWAYWTSGLPIALGFLAGHLA
ncbi:alpha/beta hydrolase [Streptomyces macrosporus]|uniref:Alpha/beta hydrolase-fold protein n=1 Tax=Streptomyces macrosporus TaxID=44032 RepID=A0ABN3JIT5_9ACTN